MAFRWYCPDHADAGATHNLYADAHDDATNHHHQEHASIQGPILVRIYALPNIQLQYRPNASR